MESLEPPFSIEVILIYSPPQESAIEQEEIFPLEQNSTDYLNERKK
jgi:hypothetical protein